MICNDAITAIKQVLLVSQSLIECRSVSHGPSKLAPPHQIRKIFVCQILWQAICQWPKDTIYKFVSSLIQTTAPRKLVLGTVQSTSPSACAVRLKLWYKHKSMLTALVKSKSTHTVAHTFLHAGAISTAGIALGSWNIRLHPSQSWEVTIKSMFSSSHHLGVAVAMFCHYAQPLSHDRQATDSNVSVDLSRASSKQTTALNQDHHSGRPIAAGLGQNFWKQKSQKCVLLNDCSKMVQWWLVKASLT